MRAAPGGVDVYTALSCLIAPAIFQVDVHGTIDIFAIRYEI